MKDTTTNCVYQKEKSTLSFQGKWRPRQAIHPPPRHAVSRGWQRSTYIRLYIGDRPSSGRRYSLAPRLLIRPRRSCR